MAIVGVVMDTAHGVLEGVDVLTREPRRNARSDMRGRFRLSDLPPGTYELTVRRIGYQIAVQTIAVTDSGGVARFCLVPEPRALPAIISSISRGGIGGVVGDSTYAVLPGAEVKALGANAQAITDSAGGFFLDVKAGSYVVTVRKRGFGTQIVGVTIPPDSGRQIAVWLTSPRRSPNRFAANLSDLHQRLLLSKPGGGESAPGSPNRAKLLSSEYLAKVDGDLSHAVRLAAIKAVSPSCEAVIDGGPFTLPLSIIDKSEIAAVEVYAKAEPRRTINSIAQKGKAEEEPTSIPNDCNVIVYVWMKP